MPAKESVWLNNVKGLFPEPGTTGKQNEATTVRTGNDLPPIFVPVVMLDLAH